MTHSLLQNSLHPTPYHYHSHKTKDYNFVYNSLANINFDQDSYIYQHFCYTYILSSSLFLFFFVCVAEAHKSNTISKNVLFLKIRIYKKYKMKQQHKRKSCCWLVGTNWGWKNEGMGDCFLKKKIL